MQPAPLRRLATCTLIALGCALATSMLATPAQAQSRPVVKQTTRGTIALTAQLSHGYLPPDTSTELYATIDLRAREAQGGVRAPMNIGLVIDRSGSMQGERFVQAIEASKRLVQMLDERDRVAVVSYGTDVTLNVPSMIATPQNKQKMLQMIDRIEIDGWTNLSGGYMMGLEQVAAHKNSETINRVILMSDGHANQGVTTPEGLANLARAGLERGISLSTMGFGLDYNEALMTRMAIEGAGSYYFVEREDHLPAIFAQEVSGLSSTVARNARVTIKLSQGVELEALHGFTYRKTGRTLTVPLAEFFARQQKDILLKLRVRTGAVGTTPGVEVRLEYDDVQNEKPVAVTRTLRAVATADGALVEEGINTAVITRVQQVEIAQSMQAAMDKYEEGQAEEAARILEQQRMQTRAARQAYNLDDEAFDRVEQEISNVAQQVKAAPAASSAGKRLRKESAKRAYDITTSAESF